MSKIKQVKIENFRNIKSLEFTVNELVTLIEGQNGIGKSNALNALVWFFSDMLQTDKWGDGETDINSIIPKDQQKGEHTLVEVTFDTGVKFSKCYKTGYDRRTGKVNKHVTEGSINDVPAKNNGAWNEELYKEINFTPKLKSVKEVNLFTDPLYALQKLDQKKLRELLVELGCSVSNEDVFYGFGFEELAQYESKYRGDFITMRKNLKDQVKKINDAIDENRTALNEYNDVNEFDEKELETVKTQLDELKAKKTLITNPTTQVKELESIAKDVLWKAEAQKNKQIEAQRAKILEISADEKIEIERLRNLNENATKGQNLKVEGLKKELDTYNETRKGYIEMLNGYRTQLEGFKAEGTNAQAQIKSLSEQYMQVKNRKFDARQMTCPNCHGLITLNENERVDFERTKQSQLDTLTLDINHAQNKVEEAKNQINRVIGLANEVKQKGIALATKIEETKNNLEQAQKELQDIKVSRDEADTAKLEKLRVQKAEAQEEMNRIYEIDPKQSPDYIEALQVLEDTRLSNKLAIENQLMELETEINSLEAKQEQLYVAKSSSNRKKELQEIIESKEREYNDVNHLLEHVKDFIHTHTKLLNKKASELLGIEFVMLEENLTNDDVKEVCYAKVAGVPLPKVNTATKYLVGIEFIEKVKDILVRDFNLEYNELPILADRLEGLDSMNLKSFNNKNQLIGTRVTDDPKMKIGGVDIE